MKGKSYNNKKQKNKLKKAIVLIFLLIFIAMMIFSGIKIINWIYENMKNKSMINNIQQAIQIDESKEKEDKYKIDFKALKKTNPDIIGWLKVNGTNIEYPVVKTNNNDYYLTHSFDKSYNTSGWVFADYKNKFDNSDKNIVIFAHNRRDASMFGSLKNILTKEWQDNSDNYIIPFITENEQSYYQVVSIYKIEKEDYYITTNFKNDTEFEKFIDEIKTRSLKDFKIDVTTNDHMLTLSTCANDNRYRVVLHAKKIEN